MKHSMKRMLAFVLSLLLLVPLGAQIATAATTYDLPIVYVAGKYAEIWNKDETQRIYPLDPPVMQTVKDNLSKLYFSYQLADKLGLWSQFADKIYDTVAPRYAALVMDGNGDPQGGTHTKAVEAPKAKTSHFYLHDYMFTYDSRIDPYENARLLNKYINDVLSATGKSQVNLIGRCLGTTVVSTYLTEYGCSKVKTAIFYAAAFNGVYMMDGFFSGDFSLDYSKIQTFLKKGTSDEGGNFAGLRDIAEVLDKISLFGWGVSSADKALKNLAPYLFPRLTLAIFGTWPGHWAMISKEAFQKAKEYTLSDTTKYAGLIEKVERYQNNVMAKFPETLESCRRQGMRIAIVSKYNIPMIPLSPNSNMQADGTVQLKTMSLGATAANIGETLSNDYISQLKRQNNDAYLSADNVVDASTCQYPDYTWFIKDCPHATYPAAINQLFLEIFRSPYQYTVKTNAAYPQFMRFIKAQGETPEQTVPLALDPINPDQTPIEPEPRKTWFQEMAEKLVNFFIKIMKFLHISD